MYVLCTAARIPTWHARRQGEPGTPGQTQELAAVLMDFPPPVQDCPRDKRVRRTARSAWRASPNSLDSILSICSGSSAQAEHHSHRHSSCLPACLPAHQVAAVVSGLVCLWSERARQANDDGGAATMCTMYTQHVQYRCTPLYIQTLYTT